MTGGVFEWSGLEGRGAARSTRMTVRPYLFFDGRCEEALEFYRKALGAKDVQISRFKENPDPQSAMPGVDPNKVMHASFRVGDATVMASDGMCGGRPSFQGFSLTLSLPTVA